MQHLIAIALLFATVAATSQMPKETQEKKHGEAAIIWSGNELYNLCQFYKTNRLKDTSGAGCVMYIAGATQMLVLNDDTEMMKSPCPGKGVTNQQIADVVIKWLDDRPEKRDLPAPYLIMTALSEAFPCH